MSETENKILQISNLSVSYGADSVVSDVSLSIGEGEILCIVGESGSGKSTLIKSILGLQEASIISGEICYKENLICGTKSCDNRSSVAKQRRNIQHREHFLGREIGFIPQNPGGSFNPLRMFEKQINEAFVGCGRTYDPATMLAIFEKIGLTEGEQILKSRPYEMSGGMNQRIAIALAFALEPKLLLCDEATSALDVTTARMVVDELLDLRKEKHTAILMVTHHLGIAKKMADRIGIMYQGKIIEYGKREEIFEHPKCEYTKRLLEDVPRLRK